MSIWTRRELLQAAAATQLPKPNRIPAAVVGIGHAHAIGKTRVLRPSDDFDLVSVCAVNEGFERELKHASAYDGLHWSRLEEILGDARIQLIVVESRVRDSLPIAIRAIRAGKHVHLDKPAGNDMGAFRSLLEEAERARRIVQLGYMWRYQPGFHKAIEAARNGWLGHVYAVRCAMSSDISSVSSPSSDPISNREALAQFPGGILFELGCHMLDRVVDLLGRPVKVTSFLRHDSAARDSLADNTLAVLEYPNAMAEIYCSAQQYGASAQRRFEVLGSNGSVTIAPIEPPTVRIDLKTAAGPYAKGSSSIEVAKYVRYEEDFRDLAMAIRGTKTLQWSKEHDLAVQETLLRASNSA